MSMADIVTTRPPAGGITCLTDQSFIIMQRCPASSPPCPVAAPYALPLPHSVSHWPVVAAAKPTTGSACRPFWSSLLHWRWRNHAVFNGEVRACTKSISPSRRRQNRGTPCRCWRRISAGQAARLDPAICNWPPRPRRPS